MDETHDTADEDCNKPTIGGHSQNDSEQSTPNQPAADAPLSADNLSRSFSVVTPTTSGSHSADDRVAILPSAASSDSRGIILPSSDPHAAANCVNSPTLDLLGTAAQLPAVSQHRRSTGEGSQPASSTTCFGQNLPTLVTAMACHGNHQDASRYEHLHRPDMQDVRMQQVEVARRRGAVNRAPRVDIPTWERELGNVRDEQGAVDLSYARTAQRWIRCCLSCREKPREVTMRPCDHSTLCRHCFLDPCYNQHLRCPLCNRQVENILVSRHMWTYLLQRS